MMSTRIRKRVSRPRSPRRQRLLNGFSAALVAGLGLTATACDESSSVEPGVNPYPCDNPMPVMVNGVDTGQVRCDNGFTHRATVVTCENLTPRMEPNPACEMGSGCASDADCTDRPFGHCEVVP